MATNSCACSSGTEGNNLSTPSDILNWSYSGCARRTQIPWATTQPVWGSSGMPIACIASTKVAGTSEVAAAALAVGAGVGGGGVGGAGGGAAGGGAGGGAAGCAAAAP